MVWWALHYENFVVHRKTPVAQHSAGSARCVLETHSQHIALASEYCSSIGNRCHVFARTNLARFEVIEHADRCTMLSDEESSF